MPGEISAEAWTRLPEPAAIRALESTAAEAFGVPDAACVVAAPGAQALIQMLPRLLPARRACILGLTYAEHEACWLAGGARVETVDAPERLADADVAVVVNPNNPDGRLLPREALIDLAARLGRGSLVVDEAFMDGEPEAASLAPALPCNAVALRSFGKLYGLAGLRLGFAVASQELAAGIRCALGPWAVSGAAIEIGQRAYADRPWREATIAHLTRDAMRLDALLREAGLSVIGGTPLFRLVASPQAGNWFERLARAGILVRPFPARADWLRFGLPGPEADWQRLEGALRSRRS